jgi:CheY-like chemotaxis protein
MEQGELRLETVAVQLETGNRAISGVEIPPGHYAVVRVHDSGRGMDAPTRTRAFEPFFTTKRAGEGVGLGLATAYGIVKQSGGFIWIDSELGRGTTVTVYLPVAKMPGPRPAPATAVALEGAAHETLLLVEDEESVRVMAARILRQRGYAVLEAATGGEAIALLERYDGPLDLLVSDIVMPEVSGLELAERLPTLRAGVRVLFVSGYSAADPALKQVAGTVTLLNKPFRAGELLSAVRRVLDGPLGEPATLEPDPAPVLGTT